MSFRNVASDGSHDDGAFAFVSAPSRIQKLLDAMPGTDTTRAGKVVGRPDWEEELRLVPAQVESAVDQLERGLVYPLSRSERRQIRRNLKDVLVTIG